MNAKPAARSLVSVVLPTYNRAHLLSDAIRSVLAQSWPELELIVVDDHSQDETPQVAQAFEDPRLRYVRNDSNQRLPCTLNRGFSLARGEYLTWTSDDNLIAPTAIERMVERVCHGNCDLVYADYYQFSDLDDQGRPQGVARRRLPEALQLARGNHIGACFLYTRRLHEVVGDYDPELFLVEDYDYWIRAAQSFSFCHIPEPLYYFRRDEKTLFWSRFAEVKSADILVRVKNGLLSEDEVLEAVLRLLLADVRNLNNAAIKMTHAVFAGRSWRLTQAHRSLASRFLRVRLKRPLNNLLRDYRAGAMTFGEAKQALTALMQRMATVQYFEPAALP